MIKTIRPLQVGGATLLGLLLVMFMRVDKRDDLGEVESRTINPITLPSLSQNSNWNAGELINSLLVIMPKPKTPSAEELARQKAELESQVAVKPEVVVDKTVKPMFSLLDDDHQIGLLAVVQENQQKFAVLQVINFESKESKTVKLLESNTFQNLTLRINSQTQVELNRSDKNIILNLFKPRNT